MEAVSRIALLPLDERPVNVDLPRDVAAVAGVVVDVPPREILPDYRTPGDTGRLAEWLRTRADDRATTDLVVSLDLLLYGGLIASRTSADGTSAVLARLELLRELHAARPELRILAVGLVMRASDSYSSTEEPDYWADYGRDLHRLSGDLHRRFVDEAAPIPEHVVPEGVLGDFTGRRLRNHIVNLASLALFQEGVLDVLAITADDTAAFAGGSAEQLWLQHWLRFLPSGGGVLMYPGADEVGAALVARALTGRSAPAPTIRVVCPEPGGLERVPPFENRPLAESVQRQLRAAGARAVDDDAADVVLVVHAPDPSGLNLAFAPAPDGDSAPVQRTAEEVRAALAEGHRVALADVRFPNGADPALVESLLADRSIDRLVAFGGWNTAGNTLGGVIATALAVVVGTRAGSLDPVAVRRALLVRVLDDWGYQSVVRPEESARLFPDRRPLTDVDALAAAESVIGDRLHQLLRDRLHGDDHALAAAVLPWRRSFEVGLTLRGR